MIDYDDLGNLIDEIDDLAHGLNIPLADGMHIKLLKETLPEKVERLKAFYLTLTGENPWD